MCVCLPYNLRNWVVCSKPRCKPLLPIHITKCNKGNKNHQAKEWSTKRTEIWRYLNRSSHVLSVFIDCEERKTRRKEGTQIHCEKEKGSSSIQRVCGCCGGWCCCCLLSCGGCGWNGKGEGEREKEGLRKEISVSLWVWDFRKVYAACK